MWIVAHVLLASLASLASLALGCTPESGSSASPPTASGQPPVARGGAGFDADRAFADLRDQVALGPRPAGSAAAGRARELIATRLRQAGFRVDEHASRGGPPGREPVTFTNLIGVRRGRTPRLLLVGAHYDTKDIPGLRFVGANDGASGVALLLELARVLGPEPGAAELWLLFLDGEEALGPSITDRDGLFGSRALAERLARERVLERVHALVLVDMVADRELSLAIDRNSSPRLRAIAAAIARDRGEGELFDPLQTLSLVDDHLPFRERGVHDVLALIDFAYGGPAPPGVLWHTAGDELGAVSAGSLNRVGELVVELLRRLDEEVAVLATHATPPTPPTQPTQDAPHSAAAATEDAAAAHGVQPDAGLGGRGPRASAPGER